MFEIIKDIESINIEELCDFDENTVSVNILTDYLDLDVNIFYENEVSKGDYYTPTSTEFILKDIEIRKINKNYTGLSKDRLEKILLKLNK